MKAPKVSVMVVTYNQEGYIGETIESVMSQGYENIELVIGNDASTDGTAEIIDDYVKRYPGQIIHLNNPKNLGITGNCNVTLQACSGDIIAILGGDDLFLPGKIRKQLQLFLNDSDLMLSYHPVKIVNGEKVIFITDQNPKKEITSAYDVIRNGGIEGASSLMFRREALPKEGFDSRLPTVSDWLFSIELALSGKVQVLNEVLGVYRKHGLGASERTYELLEESLYALDLLVEKYPQDNKLEKICRQGKARYVSGEAFRQLGKDASKAKALFAKACHWHPTNLLYRLGVLISALGPLSQWIGLGLNRFKYSIKKVIG